MSAIKGLLEQYQQEQGDDYLQRLVQQRIKELEEQEYYNYEQSIKNNI